MLLVFLLIILTPIYIFLKSYKRRYDLSLKIQGPSTWPIIGYTKILNLTPTGLFNHLLELQQQYKGLYKLWVFTDFWVIVHDPVIVEKILTNEDFTKSNDYELLKPWLGTGLLTSEGRKWFSRRKAITPAFHFSILEDFIKIFEKHTNILMEKLRTVKVVDITNVLPLYTLDNICETAMGIELNAQTDVDSSYGKAVHNVAEIAYDRMFNTILKNNFIFRFTKNYSIMRDSLKIIHTKTQIVIDKRRAYLGQEANNEDASIRDDIGQKKKMALLDVLLKSSINGKPLTNSDIEEEVNTFMFAGHDTTSTAGGFLLYNIAKYPEIQEKLITEIRDVLGTDGTGEITTTTLNNLRYLDLVIKESLRFHATVPMIGREIVDETQINEYLFPANTAVTVNVYGMCHSENLYPNSEKFTPERFEADSGEKLNPFAYIPFSAGPRNCIGQKFALYELKVLAVKVLQNFEIYLAKPEEELILAVGITLKATNGIHLKFKDRV